MAAKVHKNDRPGEEPIVSVDGQNLNVGAAKQFAKHFGSKSFRKTRTWLKSFAIVLAILPWHDVAAQSAPLYRIMPKMIQEIKEAAVSGQIEIERKQRQSLPPVSKYEPLPSMLENSLPSVVTVAVTRRRKMNKLFSGVIRSSLPPEVAYEALRLLLGFETSGSGFAISVEGHPGILIAINSHVVDIASDSTGSIYVQSINGSSYEAKVLNADAFYDFALLELVDPPGDEMRPLEFRDLEISPLRIGERVYAIGNPLGTYPYSVSEGIVSGLNRCFGGVTGKFGYVQTSATVLPGCSGSPLLDRNGMVVGMMSKIEREGSETISSSLNFALEGQICARLCREITLHGKVIRAWFGMQLEEPASPITPENPFLRIEASPVLKHVFKGADNRCELEQHLEQKLVQVNSLRVRNIEEALEALESAHPGNAVKLIFENRDQRDTVIVRPDTLGKRQLTDLAQRVLITQSILNGRLNPGEPVKIGVDRRFLRPGTGSSGFADFFVLSAGRRSTTSVHPMMHEVVFPEDLGAAIRQYSLTGWCEVMIAPAWKKFDPRDIDYLSFRFDGLTKSGKAPATLFH